MGLISPAGQSLLDFLEFWQVLSTYGGDLRDPLWCLGKTCPHASFAGASRESSPVDAGA